MGNFSTKITKKILLKEINNEMCHNYYYLVYGKIYNHDNTRYKPFKLVVFFDAFDVQEYYEKDYFTKDDIVNYLNDCIGSYIDYIKNYDDLTTFYFICLWKSFNLGLGRAFMRKNLVDG